MRRWSLTGIPGPWQRGVSTKVSVQTTHQRLVQVHLTAAIVHLSEIWFIVWKTASDPESEICLLFSESDRGCTEAAGNSNTLCGHWIKNRIEQTRRSRRFNKWEIVNRVGAFQRVFMHRETKNQQPKHSRWSKVEDIPYMVTWCIKAPPTPNMNLLFVSGTQSKESWVKGAGLKGSFQAEDEL